MKRMLVTLMLITLTGCFATSPKPSDPIPGPALPDRYGIPLDASLTAAFPAKVQIVCALVGESSDVTLGKFDKEPKFHGAFGATLDNKKLIAAPVKSIGFASKPGLDECFNEAQSFVATELPSSWNIIKAEGEQGHCWRGGGWRPCDPSVEPFDAVAFPLHKGSDLYFEWMAPFDVTAGAERKIDMLYYVLVHPD